MVSVPHTHVYINKQSKKKKKNSELSCTPEQMDLTYTFRRSHLKEIQHTFLNLPWSILKNRLYSRPQIKSYLLNAKIQNSLFYLLRSYYYNSLEAGSKNQSINTQTVQLHENWTVCSWMAIWSLKTSGKKWKGF